MRNTQMKGKQSGFTLIELIVVIVILGALAATALPRFLDLGGDARTAAHAATGGALSSSVALAHSKWLVNGSPATPSDYMSDGTKIGLTSIGWPMADASGETSDSSTPPVYDQLPAAADQQAANDLCVKNWTTLLASASASVEAVKFPAPATAQVFTKDYKVEAALTGNAKSGTGKAISSCKYTLVKDTTKTITYTFADGNVVITQ